METFAERTTVHGLKGIRAYKTVKTFYAVCTFEHGRVARARWDDDRATALESVGLLE